MASDNELNNIKINNNWPSMKLKIRSIYNQNKTVTECKASVSYESTWNNCCFDITYIHTYIHMTVAMVAIIL